jgi:hypothetical protein
VDFVEGQWFKGLNRRSFARRVFSPYAGHHDEGEQDAARPPLALPARLWVSRGETRYPIDKARVRCRERLEVARRVFAWKVQMPEEQCGRVYCRSYHMTLRHFGRLAGAQWDPSFRSKLGKAASKLYREIYGKDPPQKRASRDWRNKVAKYACGILEQAYCQLTAESQSSAGSAIEATAHNASAASADALP